MNVATSEWSESNVRATTQPGFHPTQAEWGSSLRRRALRGSTPSSPIGGLDATVLSPCCTCPGNQYTTRRPRNSACYIRRSDRLERHHSSATRLPSGGLDVQRAVRGLSSGTEQYRRMSA